VIRELVTPVTPVELDQALRKLPHLAYPLCSLVASYAEQRPPDIWIYSQPFQTDRWTPMHPPSFFRTILGVSESGRPIVLQCAIVSESNDILPHSVSRLAGFAHQLVAPGALIE